MIQNTILLILLIIMIQTSTIFNFNKKSNITKWTVVDDKVMGGKSLGKFSLNEEGNGVFEGAVSLKNCSFLSHP